MDVPAPAAGTVKQLSVKIGDRVSEGSVLLTLESDGARRRASAGPPERGTARRHADGGPGATAPPPRRSSASPPLPALRQRRRRRSRRPGGRDRLRPGRLHGRVPRRRPRAEDRADRALRHARRRLPERRLHPLQGAAPRRAGGRRGRGDGRARDHVRQGQGRPRRAARLEGSRSSASSPAASPDSPSSARSRSITGVRAFDRPEHGDGRRPDDLVRQLHHRRRLARRRRCRRCPTTSGSSTRPARSSLPSMPKRLLVIGCGIIGLEMATVYDALGSQGDDGRAARPADPGLRPRPRQAAAQADLGALRGDPPRHQGRVGRGLRRAVSR